MKSSRRNLIIVLMTVALGGIIGFQVYWIKTAMDQSETQFERNVRETLVQVADQLEEKEAQRLSSQTFVFFSEDENANVMFAPGTADITVRQLSGDKTASLSYVIHTDTVIYRDDSDKAFDQKVYYDQNNNREIKEKLEKRVRMVDVAVGKILEEEKVSIGDRVNKGELDSLIHIALEEKGIDLEFQFGVVSAGDEKHDVILSNVQEPSHDIFTSTYQASLFPNDIEGSTHFLSLYFPGQSAYILRQVGTTMIAGIICIGIILGCFIYTLQIISRQKKLSQIKNDFINNMTHELKTPIATISLATQVLSENEVLANPSSVDKYIRVIRDENTRLSNQVERVLQSALLENRELEIVREEVSVNRLIDDILETFQSVNPSVELHMALEADSDQVQADIHHLTNVVNNLLDNAVKYSRGACRVDVSTQNRENGLAIVVRDYGIGMESSQIRYIFDSFYRVSTGNLHDVKGFGLGLSYVQQIVELHEGEIDVSSAPGKGSEFTIILPHA